MRPWKSCFALLASCGLVTACSQSTTRGPEPADLGGPCGADLPCASGLGCITDARYPGGYCSATCESGACPAGGICEPAIVPPVCLAPCTTTADCRSGYTCWAGACRPACLSDGECGAAGARCVDGACEGAECAVDADCGAMQRCAAGRCIARPPVMDGGVELLPDGSPCTADGECDSGTCLSAALGGICAAACADRDDCTMTLGDFVCSPVDVDGTVRTLCVAPDLAGNFLAGACGSGTECESHACHDGQCIEACDDDGDCLPGQTCRTVGFDPLPGQSYSGCGYSDITGRTVQDVPLDDITVASGVETRRINLGIANDAVSVTLMARQTSGALLALSFIDVYDPTNTTLFDYGGLVAWEDQPVRWLPFDSESHISMLIPNSTRDRIAFRRGRYGFTVAVLADEGGMGGTAPVSLSARIKRAPGGDVATGMLTINLFLVNVGLTPATAPTDARLSGAISELGRILGAAGIVVGTGATTQVMGADATTFGVIDSSSGPTSEMARLLQLSAPRTEQAVNIFLVRSISAGAGEGGIALGIAGGIPGPPGVHGTTHSGVLVAFDRAVVGDDPRVIAQIMAHEISHYLGLFHVREQATPCAAGTGPTETRPCAPFNGEDVLVDTTRSSGTNLMWWSLGGSDGRTYNIALSAGQSFVLRRSAVVL